MPSSASPALFIDLSLIPGLPRSAVPLLQRFLDKPIPDRSALLALVESHASSFELIAKRNEFVDVSHARALASQCSSLLNSLSPNSPHSHNQLASLAAQYFVLEDDADSDYDICGLDDDATVIAAISQYLNALRAV